MKSIKDLKTPFFINYDTLTSSFLSWGGVSINLFNQNIDIEHDISILKDGEILKSEACMMVSKSSIKKIYLKKITKLLSKN